MILSVFGELLAAALLISHAHAVKLDKILDREKP